jgi:molybdopterin/thiamine biosynthesis adenylyltransferase
MAIWRFGLGAPTSGGMTPALSADRLDRFARHIVLPEVGGAGQARIMGAHVVLVGVGGIGAPALQYLAGAGVGG